MIEKLVLTEGETIAEMKEDEESAAHGGLVVPINFARPSADSEPLSVTDKRGNVIAVCTRGPGLTIAAQRSPFGIAETYEEAEPMARTGAIASEKVKRFCVIIVSWRRDG